MNTSKIHGLKTEEGKKFENFFELLQAQANSLGCVFFLDTGEGREIIAEDFEGEDLSGWLVPKHIASKFEAMWLKNETDKFDKYYVFAIWEMSGKKLRFKFKSYNI